MLDPVSAPAGGSDGVRLQCSNDSGSPSVRQSGRALTEVTIHSIQMTVVQSLTLTEANQNWTVAGILFLIEASILINILQRQNKRNEDVKIVKSWENLSRMTRKQDGVHEITSIEYNHTCR